MDAAETEELVGGRREAPKPRLTPLTSSPISAAPTGNKDKGPTKVPPMTSTQDITTPAAKEQMPENMDTSNTSKRTREEAEGKKANEIKASEEPPAKAINVRRKPTPNVLSERRIAETQPPSHLQQQQTATPSAAAVSPANPDTATTATTTTEAADTSAATDRSAAAVTTTEGAFSGAAPQVNSPRKAGGLDHVTQVNDPAVT
ncbi:hypothetical protein MTO96_025393 [Rhipicephalus appendiculatus]